MHPDLRRLGAAVVLAALGAEWLRQPGWGWTLALVATAVFALSRLTPWVQVGAPQLPRWGTALCLAALAVLVVTRMRELAQIERDWPSVREARLAEASATLGGELRVAFRAAERVAGKAVRVAGSDRTAAFRSLTASLPGSGPEVSVAILESTGVPWAWAGRTRVTPELEGDSIAARGTGYYVLLEARRQAAQGRVVVASALLWANPVVPSRERSVSELFRTRTGVDLAFYQPGQGPRSSDVFDYEEPTNEGPRLLFSVRPLPPEREAAKERSRADARGVVARLLLLLLGIALLAERRALGRLVILSAGLWLLVRSPSETVVGLGALFSPATFFGAFLGSLSSSAGMLALTATIATIAGIALWQRGVRRTWWTASIAVLLLLVAPYIISELGKGVTPPASGVSMGLWLTWQLTMVVTVSSLIVVAAALFRGRPEPTGTGGAGWIWMGVGVGLTAAVVGLVIWNPRFGWEDWYPFLWSPALLLVTRPAPRWATVAGIGLVAGSAAALVTWGAETRGRLEAAKEDMAGAGRVEEPQATPLLERFADQLSAAPPPNDASELYAAWRGSDLARAQYPSRLSLWSRQGALRAELALDSLDLPPSLLSVLVRNLDSATARRVVSLYRVPGMHYVLLQRLTKDLILTAAIGPHTRLVVPDRLGRLLRPAAGGPPLYEVTLSPPTLTPFLIDSVSQGWRREGWVLRGERRLSLPGGVRHLHAQIDLRGPAPLLVRGCLVILLDAALLALLWALAGAGGGSGGDSRRRRSWGRAMRSFQVRLAITLAAFFVIPAAGFAAWSLARLGTDAQRSRDLLITQALRDAILTAGGLLQGSPSLLNEGLRELSGRLDADMALYSGGSLVASSAPILVDLGLIEPLMDPRAYQTLALSDELETTRNAAIYQTPVRIGYRVVAPGPPGGIGVLATPQLAANWALAENQLDLALVLLLATLAGLAAALVGAQAAARALSRPVADLRRSARAVGEGLPLPAPAGPPPPREFEAVFGAFNRMASDIRASQAALEEARRRTAAVLTTVAAGVVALDREGRVVLANPAARVMLSSDLAEGQPYDVTIGSEWGALRSAVGEYLAGRPGTPADATIEFEYSGRRLRLQLTPLGSEPDSGGVVLALSDLTEVTRAERVIAWGEMARQVAHEIKNPLTPLRLGVQHLRRVFRDRQGGLDETIEETSTRILREIDRLDTIARAFSRFAAPAEEAAPMERVDLAALTREVTELYSLADSGAEVQLDAAVPVWGLARADEVKEVLGNLVENARNAGATRIRVSLQSGLVAVEDNGRGIAPELLPRIFEPRFSTTTSGSGLGLAIVKRLVEGWGGRIEVVSRVGQGTRVEVRLAGASPSGS